ncbi:hypothetical protein [Xanthobacter oligotrophicus]|uniref:hypothetical protein n=1 Tax=Xanthobacter oligotrophicus TaxID=2607286 RepID=UPI0011F1DA87|nr:hypothetical protein [Xanthobacter oligotrophicus]MCG5237118.1 hypothetical protein [Xanthobacter oligotrophicus]
MVDISPDPAHLLFPSDAPAGAEPPEWWQAERSAAEAYLMGQGHRAAKADDTAATLFPNERRGDAAPPQTPAGKDRPDAAALLFKEDAAHFDDRPVNSFFIGFANSAAADGDIERARALHTAGNALTADAKAAGTSSADLAEALSVIHERQADTVGERTAEQAEADFASGMAAIQAEGITEAQLGAARAFIADLEKLAPGTLHTLERTGAGNDLRLIRRAVAEAQRRGYR